MVAALHSYTHPTWLRFWGSGSLAESKWCHYVTVEADSLLKLLPTSKILDMYKSVWAHWYTVHWHTVSVLHSYTPLLGSDVRFSLTCGAKMMWLCHGGGWWPPQTASCIHNKHIQTVWAHWYAVNWHTVAALQSLTHPTWVRFWGSGSLVESKQYHYVIVEANSHLKLLPTSILDIDKVFEHIDMMSIGKW